MPDRIEKIAALAVAGTTPGERDAAQAAMARIQGKPILRIAATVFDADENESLYEVRYTDLDDKEQVQFIGREKFLKLSNVIEQLLKHHAALPLDRKKCLKILNDALQHKSGHAYRITRRCGLTEDGSFVYPGATFGKSAGNLFYQRSRDEIDPAFGLQSGKLELWQDGLREPCRNSDFLILALSITAASALLGFLPGKEPAVFHLHGSGGKAKSNGEKVKSSSGKTLAARCGASVTGRCRQNDLLTFAATPRALEEHCFARNHVGNFLDEAGRAEARTGPRIRPEDAAYFLTSGRGAARSRGVARRSELKNLTWGEFVLTTGEDSLNPGRASHRPEGAEVRMIGVPVPTGKNGGIFNRLDGSKKNKVRIATKLAEQVETTIESNYGVAGAAFLKQLMIRPAQEVFDSATTIIDGLVAEVGAEIEPWERRFAEKFGIILAGAILMSRFGVGPWSESRAVKAIRSLYRRARAVSASRDEAALRFIRRLQKSLRHRERFPRLRKGEMLPKHAAPCWGIRKSIPGVEAALIMRLARVERLVKPSVIAADVLAKLARDKLVIRDKTGKLTRQIMIKALSSRRRRYVCFDLKRLRAA